jgi:hypothetical protein
MRYEVTERHRRVARAFQAGGPAVPEELQRRVERTWRTAPLRGAERTWRTAPSRRETPRAWRLSALAATAGVVAVAAAIALISFAGGAPSMDALAAMSTRPATEATPAPDPSQPTLLRREFEGVAFPNWGDELGWRADGARADRIEGSAVDTVFYTHQGHRIAYTVLSGDRLEPPGDAVATTTGGVELHRFRRDGRDVVMFERGGYTCVLAGEVISVRTLVKLASWRGGGTVHF